MKEPAAEFAVSRDVLLTFFQPPIGVSTFFDLVERGQITKVKGLRGYYRLNDSLRRLGLAPVERLPREGLDDLALTDVALSLAMPDELPQPADLLSHPLTAEQVLLVARLARAYDRELREIHDSKERISFAEGVRDAAAMLAFGETSRDSAR